MKTRNLLLIALLSGANHSFFAQNVGINSTGAAPVTSAALDVDMANKGILIPRVALTSLTTFAPVTGTATASLLVYNTATISGATPGYFYWSGSIWLRMITQQEAWKVGASASDANSPIATGSFGTTNNQHVDLVTNGIVMGRISNLGEFFIGTTNTILPGDLMNGVGNASFPWALNGYTTQNGAGVYGAVQSGTTVYGGVQGQYNGTNNQGTGVRGIFTTAVGGTNFIGNTPSGVLGDATSFGSYKFGVYGNGGTSLRSGAVIGNNYGIRGALGYYANNGFDYAVYGFGGAYTTGVAAGIIKNPTDNASTTNLLKSASTTNIGVNTMIGLGIYGGVMGGWVRGLVYGAHLKGERYSLYVDGKTYTNEPITQLVGSENNRQPIYASSAMKVDVSDRGKSALTNGEIHIPFNDGFKNSISTNLDELTITVSPTGNSNGIYIVAYDENGFTVKENNEGISNVSFNWIAIGTQKGYEVVTHSPEIIDNSFDQKMNGVMFNENNTIDPAQSMWWDGENIRWDAPPAKVIDPSDISRNARSNGTSNTIQQTISE